MIKYLIKRWYYIPTSIVIYIIYSKVFNINFNIIEPFLLIATIRFIDDLYDYNKDKGKRTTKKNLVILIILFSLLYCILNIYCYRTIGFISILIIMYLLLMNKYELLKVILLPLITAYYLFINNEQNFNAIIITFIISIIYYELKRCKK